MFFLGILKNTSNRTGNPLVAIPSKSRGFTVLELLVVVAIMAVMMGLLGFTMIGGNAKKGLESGQRQVFSLMHFARVAAMSSGTESRLLVSGDMEDSDKYLRHIEVVVKDQNQSDGWRVVKEGELLPDGIWFVPSGESFENWPKDGYTQWSELTGEDFQLGPMFKGLRTENSDGTPFFSISFDSSGFAISSEMPNMPRVVLGKGELRPKDNQLLPSFSNPLDIVGIMIQPFGGMLSLDSTDFVM